MTLFGIIMSPTKAMFAFGCIYNFLYLIFCYFKQKQPDILRIFMNFVGAFAVGNGGIAILAVFFEEMRPLIDPVIVYGASGIVGVVYGLQAFGKKFNFSGFFERIDSAQL